MERRHLAIADRIIVQGEARIQKQRALIERLRLRGANTDSAETFLALLEETLAGWIREREMILVELAS
ncbi:MAG TPA: hypothetical protein VHE36_02455 [Sphingomicrobium sp.]|jgi:hypothetical protein|nr:hypothetical protein [Sphingomicrobium sp.]